MLATLQIEIDCKDKKAINFSKGSLFHGVLMEKLDTDYVEYLHNQPLNPYSQYVYFDKEKDNFVWKISTLTKEAKENIIDVFVEKIGDAITLSHDEETYKIKSKSIVNIKSYPEIVDSNFLKDDKDKKNIVNVQLLTPTTYKSNGDYQIMPSIQALYCSVYNKWNVFSDKVSLADEEVFRHILEHSLIIGYNLKSYKYNIEKVRLNSFIGDFNLLLKGPKELVSISNMLLEFGEYSGLGAKTSMGMGGMKIE